MDVRQLRHFVAVAEELHFGRAAARLHIAQPAVSQTIRAIENELGVTLFERTNRRVTLTAAGRSLLDEARAVIGRFDRALATMARVRDGERAQLRMGAVPALPPSLIPQLLAAFGAATPAVTTVVRAIPSGLKTSEALAGAELDLVLVRGECDEPGVSSVVVAKEAIGVALPSAHPLAASRSITPRDLNSLPLISFSRATDPVQYDQLFDALAAAGLDNLRVMHESHPGAVDASLRLVESGAGLSLKLASEVDTFASGDVTWRPLAGVELDVVVSAAWRPDRVVPALAGLLPLLRRRSSQE